MIAADKRSIEQALKKERRTSQRQVLLKQLWRLSRHVSENEQAGSGNAAKGPKREAKGSSESE